ncbi:MAG: FkbM family methyltransferase [Parvularculaceae bacterium]|nr:FkbM family methyltransferase [Parvularculaceae bacterium]
MTDSFGALSPSSFQEGVRAISRGLPANYWGRRFASILLGPAGGRARRAYDVCVFGSQKARLHPYDNICEKRVFLTPQLWDGEERALLSEFISEHAGREFHFVDVGANAGLYTLFARAEAMRAGARFRGLCIEADPEMAARLRFNLAVSGALSEVRTLVCAASDTEGALGFSRDATSRGLSRVDPDGEMRVNARPLHLMVSASGLERIDAMKIDIEGHEFTALSAFFKSAPPWRFPRFLILETSHEKEGASALGLALGAGYETRLRTRRNAVLAFAR